MRAGWEGNTRLQDFVRRVDSGAHLIAEVVAVEGYDTKRTKSEWAAGSVAGGSRDVLDDGGARLDATGATLASHGPDDGTQVTGLTVRPPFDVLVLEHLGNGTEDREFDTLTARLDPRADAGQPKTVDHFIAEAYRIHKRDGADYIHVELIARAPKVDATGGEVAADFVFEFQPAASKRYPNAGDPPEEEKGSDRLSGDEAGEPEETMSSPQTLFRILAFQADGSVADNVAWMADSAEGSLKTDSSTYIVRHYDVIFPAGPSKAVEGGSVWELGGAVDNMPDFSIDQATYPDTVTIALTDPHQVPALP